MKRQLEIAQQRPQDVPDSIFSAQNQTIDKWSPYQAHLSTKCQCFSNVSTTPDTRVEQYIEFVADCLDDSRKHVKRGDASVNLPTAMVAHDDTLTTCLDSFLGVLDRLDSLQNNGAIPVLAQELEIFPAMADRWEDRCSPFCSSSVYILFNLDAVLFLELFAEYGVREADGDTDLVGSKKRVVPGTQVRKRSRQEVGDAYPLSMSLGRQPSMYVSKVTMRALKPLSLARFSREAVMSLC